MTSSRQGLDKVKLVLLAAAVMLLAGAYLAHAGLNTIVISNSGTISRDIMARSGSATDIQTAVNLITASGGRGRVLIPAGNFNFVNVGQAWQTVNVPAGIDILGAPTQRDAYDQVVQWQTVLIMPYDVPGDWNSAPVWFKIGNGSQDLSKPARFSDIKLQGYRSINASSTTIHVGIEIHGVINFRIDHSMFEHTTGGGVNIPPYLQHNMKCCGVIDHCRFVNIHGWDDLSNYVNGNIGYAVEVSRAYNTAGGGPMPFEPTMDVLGKYTDHSVFIEDSYFSKWRHIVSSGHGGYYVFRHNIIDQDFAHFSLDVHGLRDTQAGRAGGRGAEVYENVFQNVQTTAEDPSPPFRAVMQDGGGCGVFFNNLIDSTYRAGAFSLYAEDTVASPTWHLADFYMWGQKGTWTPPNWNGLVPGFTASRHVEAYWSRSALDSSDPSYPNVDSNWSIAGYKPYVYPHPLTIGQIPAF